MTLYLSLSSLDPFTQFTLVRQYWLAGHMLAIRKNSLWVQTLYLRQFDSVHGETNFGDDRLEKNEDIRQQ